MAAPHPVESFGRPAPRHRRIERHRGLLCFNAGLKGSAVHDPDIEEDQRAVSEFAPPRAQRLPKPRRRSALELLAALTMVSYQPKCWRRK